MRTTPCDCVVPDVDLFENVTVTADDDVAFITAHYPVHTRHVVNGGLIIHLAKVALVYQEDALA